MTQAQFTAAVRRAGRRLSARAAHAKHAKHAKLEAWMKALCDVPDPPKDVRKKAREETGHYFVRTYTVPAHWCKLPTRR